jgi:hypothetical protein
MICNLCNKSFGRQGGSFNKHLLKEHNIIDYLSYIIQTEYDNKHPLCSCGCGEKTIFHNNEFKKFIHGHNIYLLSKKIKESRPISEIVELYNEGKTGDEISQIFNIDRSYIFKILSEHSIIRDQSKRKIKYKIDDSIFEIIDNEEKAYWFGFLFADGYINYKKNSITLCLSNKDFNILENFKLFLKTEKEIRKNNKFSSKVVIENKKIANDLKINGLLQAKTHILKFPKIKKNLIRHFIRGYFDGDGCVTYGKKLNKNCSISITSTLNFLKEIDKYIEIHFCYSKRHKGRDNEIYTINSGGIGNLMKFYSYLYKNSNFYMDRKKIKFEDWFKYYFDNFKLNKKTIEMKNNLGL